MPDETAVDNPLTHLVEHTEDAMREAEQGVKHLFSSDPTPTPVVTEELPTMPDEISAVDAVTDATTDTPDTSADLSLVACPSCGAVGGLLASDVKAPKGSTFANCLKCSRRVVL